MRRFLPWLLAALPLVPGAMPAFAEDPKPAPGSPPSPQDAARAQKVAEARRLAAEDLLAFKTRVNQAIDRGVVWLKAQQKKEGNFPAFGDHLPANTYNPMDLGVNAIVMLTLARSGLTLDDAAIKKLLVWCQANYAKMRGLKHVDVYPATELIMALDALYNRPPPPDPKVPDRDRDRYGNVPGAGTPEKKPCKYPQAALTWIQECVDVLKNAQTKGGGWRYPGNDMKSVEGDVDMSNTQYALLGLDTAARCGVNVPLDVYLRALDYVLREQEKDGGNVDLWVENSAWEPGLDQPPRWQKAGKAKARGWCYLPGNKEAAIGSMTAGAVSCLAIVKERVGEAGKLTPELGHRIDHAMLDGLGWLGDAFTVETNPVVPSAPAMWHYYYLYALERVGALTGVRYLEKHDWYREGADYLTGAQEKNGGWKVAPIANKPADNTDSEITQTCFALLFLKRATSPPAVPVTPPMLTGAPDAPAVDNRGGMDDK